MGIQSLVKGTFASIKRNNSTNARAARELDRRVTEIAADLERSPNPDAEERLTRIVNTVSEGFAIDPKKDDAAQRLAPVFFMKRQELIIKADQELNELKAPPPNRQDTMKDATMKDYKSLDHEIKKLSESAVTTLEQINALLPARKDLMDPEACKRISSIVAEQTGINELQVAIVQFNEKLEGLTDKGIIDKNLSVIIYKLEEPDSEPTVHNIPMDHTFGELAERLIVASVEGDEEEDDEPPVDFWVKKIDGNHNVVTKTQHWWEYQNPQTRVSQAFPVDGKCRVELVAKHGEYVVALIDDGGRERCKAVGMSKRRGVAKEYLTKQFDGRKLIQILKLQDGTDISEIVFNRNNIPPLTNPIYVKLEASNASAECLQMPSAHKGKMLSVG